LDHFHKVADGVSGGNKLKREPLPAWMLSLAVKRSSGHASISISQLTARSASIAFLEIGGDPTSFGTIANNVAPIARRRRFYDFARPWPSHGAKILA